LVCSPALGAISSSNVLSSLAKPRIYLTVVYICIYVRGEDHQKSPVLDWIQLNGKVTWTQNTAKIKTENARSNGDFEPHQVDPHLQTDFLDNVDKLSREQAGHLRHFHNLATLPYGQWDGMGSQVPGQEWLEIYRYQLTAMAYASGAAHFHRLPALRAPFK
jgi:hypothetical protein